MARFWVQLQFNCFADWSTWLLPRSYKGWFSCCREHCKSTKELALCCGAEEGATAATAAEYRAWCKRLQAGYICVRRWLASLPRLLFVCLIAFMDGRELPTSQCKCVRLKLRDSRNRPDGASWAGNDNTHAIRASARAEMTLPLPDAAATCWEATTDATELLRQSPWQAGRVTNACSHHLLVNWPLPPRNATVLGRRPIATKRTPDLSQKQRGRWLDYSLDTRTPKLSQPDAKWFQHLIHSTGMHSVENTPFVSTWIVTWYNYHFY